MINRTSCHPIWSVIILVIKQIRLPLCGHLTTLITHMITDWIGLHSVLFPLLICCKPPWRYQQTVNNAWGSGLDNLKLDGGFVKHCLKNLFYNWALEIVDEKVINKLLVGCSSFQMKMKTVGLRQHTTLSLIWLMLGKKEQPSGYNLGQKCWEKWMLLSLFLRFKALESTGNYKTPPSTQKKMLNSHWIISDSNSTNLTRVGRGEGPLH